jgi:UDP-4-amino-4,6-dideoxy-N-acetyl-beta-L-altrosamine N-acetyltransferase
MVVFEHYKISPIGQADKDTILGWRNLNRIRANMYHDHIISQPEHDTWFEQILIDKTASYFIFLYNERPVGLVSFSNISYQHGRCSWAFYLGDTAVPRGTGSAMEFFALDYAFLTLNMRKLCCEVFEFNSNVIRLHQKFGFTVEGKLVEHHLKNGKYMDIICLAKFGTTWAVDRDKFRKRIFGSTDP